MGITDEVGTRACANTISHASRVTKIRSVGDAEGCASLGDGDAGDLPAPEYVMREPRSFVERQCINVADRQIVAHIEVGTGSVGGEVVGVHEIAVISIRGVIERMAECVGKAHGEVPQCAPGGHLHRVVAGVRLIFQAGDGAESHVRAERVGIIATSNAEIG